MTWTCTVCSSPVRDCTCPEPEDPEMADERRRLDAAIIASEQWTWEDVERVHREAWARASDPSARNGTYVPSFQGNSAGYA